METRRRIGTAALYNPGWRPTLPLCSHSCALCVSIVSRGLSAQKSRHHLGQTPAQKRQLQP